MSGTPPSGLEDRLLSAAITVNSSLILLESRGFTLISVRPLPGILMDLPHFCPIHLLRMMQNKSRCWNTPIDKDGYQNLYNVGFVLRTSSVCVCACVCGSGDVVINHKDTVLYKSDGSAAAIDFCCFGILKPIRGLLVIRWLKLTFAWSWFIGGFKGANHNEDECFLALSFLKLLNGIKFCIFDHQ